MRSLWATCQQIGVLEISNHVDHYSDIQYEENLEQFFITLPTEPLEIVDIVNEGSDDPSYENDIDRDTWRGFTWEFVWLFGRSWFVQSWESTKENAAIKVVDTLLENTSHDSEQRDEGDENSGEDFLLVHYKNGKRKYVSSDDERNLDAMSTLLKGNCWIFNKPINATTEFSYETIVIPHAQ